MTKKIDHNTQKISCKASTAEKINQMYLGYLSDIFFSFCQKYSTFACDDNKIMNINKDSIYIPYTIYHDLHQINLLRHYPYQLIVYC